MFDRVVPLRFVRFRHELVREVICELVPRMTLCSIHEEVATQLSATGEGEATPEEMAQHFEAGGRDGEAADMYERAADEQLAHGDSVDAADLLVRALAALERAQTQAQTGTPRRIESPERLVRLRIKLAQRLNEASRWEEAKTTALEAHGAALQTGDAVLAARAAQQLARAAAELGDLPVAESLLSEAHEAALACGDLELAAELASDLGEAKERGGDLSQAMATLLGALDRLEAASRRARGPQGAGTSSRLAEVLNRLGSVSLRAARGEEALGYLEQALQWAHAAGDSPLAARVLGNLGHARAAIGDTVGAVETLNQAVRATMSLGDRVSVAKLLHTLAQLQLGAGRRDEAMALAREAFDLSVEIGWREGEAMGAALLGQLGA
jgi:tetratricopeptide (TPR) repeat protein